MDRPDIPNKKEILKKLKDEQDHKCFYCGIPFDTPYDRKSQGMFVTKWTKPILDHFIPWAYTEEHNEDLFVVSCEICNKVKSGKMPKEDIIHKVRKGFNKKLKSDKIRFLMKDLPKDVRLGTKSKDTKIPKDS